MEGDNKRKGVAEKIGKIDFTTVKRKGQRNDWVKSKQKMFNDYNYIDLLRFVQISIRLLCS